LSGVSLTAEETELQQARALKGLYQEIKKRVLVCRTCVRCFPPYGEDRTATGKSFKGTISRAASQMGDTPLLSPHPLAAKKNLQESTIQRLPNDT
jgi:hypothetical protein